MQLLKCVNALQKKSQERVFKKGYSFKYDGQTGFTEMTPKGERLRNLAVQSSHREVLQAEG